MSAGANGETHFNVKVVSAAFEGQNTVKRHRQVYGVSLELPRLQVVGILLWHQAHHAVCLLVVVAIKRLSMHHTSLHVESAGSQSQVLQEELRGSVHALSLTTRTPDEEAIELSRGNV